MRKDGWPALCIHGDKQQTERDWVLARKEIFSRGCNQALGDEGFVYFIVKNWFFGGFRVAIAQK